jgi:hypothetical protein
MLIEISEIEKQILDCDGSCRDINIEDVSFEYANEIAVFLSEVYALKSAVNSEGEDVVSSIRNGNLQRQFDIKPNSIHAVYENESALIANMQVYWAWGNKGDVYVEFTFFPEDVANEFSFSSFEHFVQPLIRASGSSIYFVRYENASWKFGDTSPEGGVIYQGKIG